MAMEDAKLNAKAVASRVSKRGAARDFWYLA